MRAIDKVAAQLQPQRIAGDPFGAFTTPQLAAVTGLAVNTCNKACKELAAQGRAFKMEHAGNWLWFSQAAEAVPLVAEPPTLPAPDFSPPSNEPEPLPAEDEGLPRHIYRPPARFYHQRSPKNRFITRCGIRINDHWKSVDPRNTTLSQCAQCQRAGQIASSHKHGYATEGRHKGRCKCGAWQKG
jgi:hypothetical protein